MSNKQMIDNLARTVELAKTEFMLEFLSRWNRRTPVQTGKLKAGNKISAATGQFEMTNEVPYFTYVENGTPNMNPVGMLKTTVSEAPRIWDEAMKRAKRK